MEERETRGERERRAETRQHNSKWTAERFRPMKLPASMTRDA